MPLRDKWFIMHGRARFVVKSLGWQLFLTSVASIDTEFFDHKTKVADVLTFQVGWIFSDLIKCVGAEAWISREMYRRVG